MALNFDVSNIIDHEYITTAYKKPGDEDPRVLWNPVTEALVWASIPCGFDSITIKNLDVVQSRVAIWQQVMGSLLTAAFVTHDDISKHIGLTTNASTKTPLVFAGYMLERLADNAKRSERVQAFNAMDKIGWKGRAPS